jgi:hypothetical protein
VAVFVIAPSEELPPVFVAPFIVIIKPVMALPLESEVLQPAQLAWATTAFKM